MEWERELMKEIQKLNKERKKDRKKERKKKRKKKKKKCKGEKISFQFVCSSTTYRVKTKKYFAMLKPIQ